MLNNKNALSMVFLVMFSGFTLADDCGDSDSSTWCIQAVDRNVFGTTFCNGRCDSSDTIYINGGPRGDLTLCSFDGQGSYIAVRNRPGETKVVITADEGDSSGGIVFAIVDSKYLDIEGSSSTVPQSSYGIEVHNDGTNRVASTLRVKGESDHIKIGYMDLHCRGSNLDSGVGIHVHDTALKDRVPQWIFDNIEIHNNYIHDINYAAMYIGHNDPDATLSSVEYTTPYVANIKIHDNLLEDLDDYGITVKGMNNGGVIDIYDNILRRTGPNSRHSPPDTGKLTCYHFKGIRPLYFEGDTTINVYGNWVEDTYGPGIGAASRYYDDNSHSVNIYDNIIVNGGSCGQEADSMDCYSSALDTTPGTCNVRNGVGIILDYATDNAQVHDNIIVQPGLYGITAEHDATGILSRNKICDIQNPSGSAFVRSGLTVIDNAYEPNCANFNFNRWSDDGDYSNDDFGTEGESCNDGIQNQDETGVDCGGICPPCDCLASDETFKNYHIGPQASRLDISFDVIPREQDMDGVIGITSGPADWYSDFAATVRFNQNNIIDTRDNESYRYDNLLQYTAGITYHVRMSVNIGTEKFDLFVAKEGGPEIQIADNYVFRYPGVNSLDSISYISGIGIISICSIETSSCAGLTDLINSMNQWKANQMTMMQVLAAIMEWKNC